MFKSFAVIALATTAALVSGQALTVATPPSLVQCQPVILNWAGGMAPYIVDVIPGGQTQAAALENLQNAATGTSYSWTVNLAAGTSVNIKVTDSQGNINYSSPLTILMGSDNSCLNATATSAAGSAGVTGQSMTSASATMSGSMASSSAMSSMSSMSSMSRSSMSSTMSMSSSSGASSTAPTSSAAAQTSGAAYKKYEVPAAIIAAVGGVAALF